LFAPIATTDGSPDVAVVGEWSSPHKEIEFAGPKEWADRFVELVESGALRTEPGVQVFRAGPTTVLVLPGGRKSGRNGAKVVKR
jgi:hypothetical protein